MGAGGRIDHSRSSVGKAPGQSPDDPDHHCNDWMKIIVMMRLIMTMILMMLMMMMVNGWKSPWSVTRRPWSTL